jgi:RNA polymerase sigma factor (sigma-70 family)
MKAYENFNPDFPNRFSGFLNLHVRGEIARLWHDQNIVNKGDFTDGEAVVSVPLNEETVDENTTEDKDHHNFLLKLLRESTGTLDARELQVLNLIYNENPQSQADVARFLRLSRERVRQIHDAAVAKLGRELRRKMNENGVNQ